MIHQQVWRYKVEEKLHLGVREEECLNISGLDHDWNDEREIL
jgi:hypothetical protein